MWLCLEIIHADWLLSLLTTGVILNIVSIKILKFNSASKPCRIQYCTHPAGWVTFNFHLSCKHMHLSFKSVCNKEHKGVICNMTSWSNSFQSTHPTLVLLGKNYSSFLYFTCNYKRTSGIFVPWLTIKHTRFWYLSHQQATKTLPSGCIYRAFTAHTQNVWINMKALKCRALASLDTAAWCVFKRGFCVQQNLCKTATQK